MTSQVESYLPDANSLTILKLFFILLDGVRQLSLLGMSDSLKTPKI